MIALLNASMQHDILHAFIFKINFWSVDIFDNIKMTLSEIHFHSLKKKKIHFHMFIVSPLTCAFCHNGTASWFYEAKPSWLIFGNISSSGFGNESFAWNSAMASIGFLKSTGCALHIVWSSFLFFRNLIWFRHLAC